MTKMNKKVSYYLSLVFLVSSCASTIRTTGEHDFEAKITSILIECTTPGTVNKFSNNLCMLLKEKMVSQGINTSIKMIDETIPSITSDSTGYEADLLLKISHIRVSLYNGMPCGTLMNVEAIKKGYQKPIWAARIQTKGTNLTGPGNPDRISTEIIDQMIKDNFNFY